MNSTAITFKDSIFALDILDNFNLIKFGDTESGYWKYATQQFTCDVLLGNSLECELPVGLTPGIYLIDLTIEFEDIDIPGEPKYTDQNFIYNNIRKILKEMDKTVQQQRFDEVMECLYNLDQEIFNPNKPVSRWDTDGSGEICNIYGWYPRVIPEIGLRWVQFMTNTEVVGNRLMAFNPEELKKLNIYDEEVLRTHVEKDWIIENIWILSNVNEQENTRLIAMSTMRAISNYLQIDLNLTKLMFRFPIEDIGVGLTLTDNGLHCLTNDTGTKNYSLLQRLKSNFNVFVVKNKIHLFRNGNISLENHAELFLCIFELINKDYIENKKEII